MKFALMSERDPASAYYEQLGPHAFVRELFDEEPEFHDDLVEDIRQVDDTVQVNWIYDGAGGFNPPPDPPPPELAVSSTFLSRFSDSEYAAFITKAEDALREAKPDATLQRFLDLLRLDGAVRLTANLTNAAKDEMIGSSILSQARADEVFKP